MQIFFFFLNSFLSWQIFFWKKNVLIVITELISPHFPGRNSSGLVFTDCCLIEGSEVGLRNSLDSTCS